MSSMVLVAFRRRRSRQPRGTTTFWEGVPSDQQVVLGKGLSTPMPERLKSGYCPRNKIVPALVFRHCGGNPFRVSEITYLNPVNVIRFHRIPDVFELQVTVGKEAFNFSSFHRWLRAFRHSFREGTQGTIMRTAVARLQNRKGPSGDRTRRVVCASVYFVREPLEWTPGRQNFR